MINAGVVEKFREYKATLGWNELCWVSLKLNPTYGYYGYAFETNLHGSCQCCWNKPGNMTDHFFSFKVFRDQMNSELGLGDKCRCK
jgi:hypothetical protein